MTLLMITPMALIMIFSMKPMYKDKKMNRAIIILALIIFVLCFIFLRTQFLIGDKQYLENMIPHHSSAILTSSYAKLQDVETKQLAQNIIETQEKEITQMKEILRRLGMKKLK